MGDGGDEDDDKPPTKYGFSVESKLDEDHLFYLQFTNNFISNVTRPRDYDHCSRWLEKLAGEPMYGIAAKRNRNMYLAMLLVAMQDNRVIGPFMTFPPAGPLANAGQAFGLTTAEENEGTTYMLFEEKDRELNMKDYQFASEDGRCYIATRSLADSMGVMAYVGLTTGGGEGLWINREGEKVSLTDLCPERIEALTTNTSVFKQVERYENFDWQEPPKDPDDPFMYLIKLPESHSEQKLLEVGSYKLEKHNVMFLKENYPEELVKMIGCLMEKSKKNIETVQRQRHNRIVTQLYEAYQREVEMGLLEYKEARQEWQEVFNAMEDVKRTIAEKNARNTESARTNNHQMNLLHSTLTEAKKRKTGCIGVGVTLEGQKNELHIAVHDRALFHKHEIARMNKHVDKLAEEIHRLRGENRRKQQVIDSLVHDLEDYAPSPPPCP